MASMQRVLQMLMHTHRLKCVRYYGHLLEIKLEVSYLSDNYPSSNEEIRWF